MCPLPVTWMWWDCVWKSSEASWCRVFVCMNLLGSWWLVEAWRHQGSRVTATARHGTVTTRGVGRANCHSASAENSRDTSVTAAKPATIKPTSIIRARHSSPPRKFKQINSNESQIYFLCFCWLSTNEHLASFFFEDFCKPSNDQADCKHQTVTLPGIITSISVQCNFQIVSKDFTSQIEKPIQLFFLHA